MIILGIESSCDDTAAAVLESPDRLLGSVVSSQDTIHSRFGGVVPELASRSHMESIIPVVDAALEQAGTDKSDVDLIAVTRGPGLVGSLLVGFSYAKSLSYALDTACVGVDHMAGHLLSAFLEPEKPSFPYVALVVSGGTTSLFRVDGFIRYGLLGRTRDDAAGEVFDKLARYLQLGYPGGPVISRLAAEGDPGAILFPRAMLEDGSLDFSFSGLKTAVINYCHRSMQDGREVNVADVCAAFEAAVVEILTEKTLQAAAAEAVDTIVLGGGVSANNALRNTLRRRCREEGKRLFLPAFSNCTDNAAMIAFAGLKLFESGRRLTLADDVFSRSQLGH